MFSEQNPNLIFGSEIVVAPLIILFKPVLSFWGHFGFNGKRDRDQPGKPKITNRPIEAGSKKTRDGTMAYLNTYETSQSSVEAIAAEGCLFELGLVCATGRDGNKDLVSAHKWFNIAAARGCIRSKARREEIAEEMSKSQIALAQRAAREWITTH